MTALALLVLAGAGAAGSVVRYLAAVALPARRGLPWGVLLVNVAGSFAAGLALAAVDDAALRLAIVTGFCGGLTTFSTHAVDTVRLATGEGGGGNDDDDGGDDGGGDRGERGDRGNASVEVGIRARRAPSIRLALAVANVAVTLVLALAAVSAGAALAGGPIIR